MHHRQEIHKWPKLSCSITILSIASHSLFPEALILSLLNLVNLLRMRRLASSDKSSTQVWDVTTWKSEFTLSSERVFFLCGKNAPFSAHVATTHHSGTTTAYTRDNERTAIAHFQCLCLMQTLYFHRIQFLEEKCVLFGILCLNAALSSQLKDFCNWN